MTRFLPILLGSDINVYGMARAFHEAYGIVSRAYAYFQLSPTKFSRIVDVHIVPDFNNFVTFRDTMLAEGKRLKQEDPDRALLLIPCGIWSLTGLMTWSLNASAPATILDFFTGFGSFISGESTRS